jgi:dTDP-4-dehydrorhamnose 3,5-epimerase
MGSRLPAGVILRPLVTHADERGDLTEVYRSSWTFGLESGPVQWNWLRSRGGTLRGVQVHPRRRDYVVVVSGRVVVGLRDLRVDRSSSTDAGITVVLEGAATMGLEVPPGIAHGFLYVEDTLQLSGLAPGWAADDDLRCRWDDPALAIPWPEAPRQLSVLDASAGSFADLRAAYVAQSAAIPSS